MRRHPREMLELVRRLHRQGVATEADLRLLLPRMAGGAGELWRQDLTIGLETVAGTAVPTTHRMYGDVAKKAGFTRVRPPHLMDVMTGTRDNQRDIKLRAVQIDGTFDQPISPDENLEIFAATFSSGVVPTISGITGHQWVFTPNSTSSSPVDSQTWEWYDAARNWQIAGAMVDQLDMSGTVATDTALTAKLFGREMILNAATTPAPAERLPDFLEGWEAKVYIDAIGATPGTTEAPSTVTAYSLTFKNNLGRKYFADNTIQLGEVVVGTMGLHATITMEAASSYAAAEYAHWEANEHRLIRLELGNNEVIGAGPAKKLIQIDIPAGWTAADLTPEDAQTKVYKFEADYIYDPTNAFGCRVTAINGRTAMYA